MVREADIVLGCATISGCTDFSVVLEQLAQQYCIKIPFVKQFNTKL